MGPDSENIGEYQIPLFFKIRYYLFGSFKRFQIYFFGLLICGFFSTMMYTLAGFDPANMPAGSESFNITTFYDVLIVSYISLIIAIFEPAIEKLFKKPIKLKFTG